MEFPESQNLLQNEQTMEADDLMTMFVFLYSKA